MSLNKVAYLFELTVEILRAGLFGAKRRPGTQFLFFMEQEIYLGERSTESIILLDRVGALNGL